MEVGVGAIIFIINQSNNKIPNIFRIQACCVLPGEVLSVFPLLSYLFEKKDTTTLELLF